MFDILIAFAVIAVPTILAVHLIDRFSESTSTYRTREQELGAAGVFHAWSSRADRPARSSGIVSPPASRELPIAAVVPRRTAPAGNGRGAGSVVPNSPQLLADPKA